jgi:mannose-6-phosphate isomerase-like protein (cupin superfamily)
MTSKELLDSGLLELYAIGCLEGSELDLVKRAMSDDPEIVREVAQIERTVRLLAQAGAVAPNPTIKSLLLAKVDYAERIANGEIVAMMPVLNERSRIEEFEHWLSREDMQMNSSFDDAQVCIISDEPEKMTAIVWLKAGAPPEVHTDEYEKFLIVEGTCDLTIGESVNNLQRGDFLSVPLHISHNVRVTSAIPCKIILQRVKARASFG